MNVIDSLAMLDYLPIGVCILAGDGKVCYWNKCLENWTKVDKKQIIGQNINHFFPQFNLLKHRKKLQKTFDQGKTVVFSEQISPPLFACKTSKRKLRLLQTTVTAIPSADGVGYDAMLSIQDMNKIAQLSQAKAKSHLQDPLSPQFFEDHQAVKLLIESSTGKIIKANKSACGFYGYTEQTIKQMKIVDLVISPSGKPIPPKALKILTYPGHFVFCHRLASGEIRHVEVHSSKIQQRNKKIIYSIIHDITERFKAEKAFREIINRLNRIIQSSPLAIIIVDVNGAIKLWNPSAEKLFGWTQQEILSQNNTPIAQNAKQLFENQLKNNAQHNSFSGIELQQIKKNGSLIDVSWSGACLKDENDEIVGTINIVEDITERKKAEKFLRFHSEQERLINFISRQIRLSLNLSEILQTTVTEVENFLQAERVMIYRLKSQNKHDLSIINDPIPNYTTLQESSRFLAQQASLIQLFQSGLLELLADTYIGDSPVSLQEREGITQLTIPILQNQTLWGWLIAQKRKSTSQYWELQLLKQLETQLAIAIHQAEVYQQLQIANQKLQQLANQDGLTQIANRRSFDDYLAQVWCRLSLEKAYLSIILCDIDYFKLYNDTYGHLAGDDCLFQIAHAIHQIVTRPDDLVARYGGEEFAVILPNTNAASAIYVAQAIQSQINQLKIVHASSKIAQQITLSLGIASTIPIYDSSPQSLIEEADKALYQAKQEGRNCYKFNF